MDGIKVNIHKLCQANGGLAFRIRPYIITDKILDEHLRIIREDKPRFLSTVLPKSVLEIKDWAEEQLKAREIELYAILERDSDELIGTCKVTLIDEASFAIGILLSGSYHGMSVDRCVKGALMNSLFFERGFRQCKGGCNEANYSSISFYKYFGFALEKSESEGELRFSLSRERYIERLGEIYKSICSASGFDVGAFNGSYIMEKLIDLPGYSSLTFFSFISDLLSNEEETTVMDLYEKDTILEMIACLSPAGLIVNR